MSEAATQVVCFPMILSYPRIFPSKADKNEEGGTLKYSAELWAYQNGNSRYVETYQALFAAVEAARVEKWGPKGVNFSHDPIKDLNSKENPPEEAGFFIRANSYTPPGVFKKGEGGQYVPVTDPEDAYAGVVVAAVVRAAGYEVTEKNMTSRGVKFYLNQILLLKDGPRLGGGAQAKPDEVFGGVSAEHFGVLTGGMDAAVQGMPGIPGMPQMPGIPGMPQMPGVPGMPQMPPAPGGYGIPGVPGMPQVAQAPGGYGIPGMPQMPQAPGGYGIPGLNY